MAKLNIINEGQPLTYELINQMISAINSLVPEDGETPQIVEFVGDGLPSNKDQKIKVCTGQAAFGFDAGETKATATINFPSGGFESVPRVAISVVDPTADQGQVSFLLTTIIDLNKNSCRVRARRIGTLGNQNRDQIRLQYIAIGLGGKID